MQSSKILKIGKHLFVKRLLTDKCPENVKRPDNLTAVLHGKNDLRLEKRPIKTPKPNEVLLQIESVGICGSDVKYLTEGKISNFIVKEPMVAGHEGSGTVLEIGKEVKKLKVGDRVAIEPGIPCRSCPMCKEGRYNLCPNIYFCATPPNDGNLQRFYVHDGDFCFKIPDSMSFDEAATVEPLACACRAIKRAQIKSGSHVLVLGAGPIGLMTAAAAKANKASKVLVADIKNSRLRKAKELGADDVIDLSGFSENEVTEIVQCKFKGKPSITFECSGTEACARLGMINTQMGGKLVIIGCGPDEMKLPLMSAVLKEIDMLGVFRFCNDYPTAIELIQKKLVDPNPMITHHFKIEESVEAFETHKTGKGDPIKIIIHPNVDWKPKKKTDSTDC